MTWAAWLMALAGPLVVKALVYLGFGLVTFGAVMTVVQQLASALQGYWNGMPSAILQLCGLAGLDTAVSILLGAQLARTALWIKANGKRMLIKAALS